MRAGSFVILSSVLLSLMGCCATKTTRVEPLPPGGVLRVGGHKLFFRQTGTGPDVVLLHGLGDSSLGWQFIEPALVQAGYRVTVWDALGAGRSDKPSGDYSIQAHVQRLERMLDALGIERAVLVGHSLGGTVALRMAEEHPERVVALCLIDPGAYRAGAMGGRWFWKTPLLAEAVLGLLPSRTLTALALERNFHNRAAISTELKRACLREARRAGAVAALIAQERQLVPRDPEKWEQAHRALHQRVLILWGREDRLVSPAQGTRLAKDIKRSALVVLPGVGHSAPLEAPQLVLDRMLPFLSQTVSK